MRILPFLLAAALVVALAASGSAQFQSKPNLPDDGALHAWWSWIYWWEIDGHEFLHPPPADPEAPVEALPPAFEALRPRAVQALRRAAHSQDVDLAVQSVLALGRIGGEDATQYLIPFTQRSGEVGDAAWLALAHLPAPEAQRFLQQADNLSQRQTVAWLYALGLLDELEDDLAQRVEAVLDEGADSDPSTRYAAVWVLRKHRPAQSRKLMRSLLLHSNDSMLVSEAMLALGAARDAQAEKLLAQITLHSNEVVEVTCLARLHQLFANGRDDKYGPSIAGLNNAAAIALGHFSRQNINNSAALDALRKPLRRVRIISVRPHRGDQPRRYPLADLGWLGFEPSNGRRLSLISLGRVGQPTDIELLLDALAGELVQDYNLYANDKRLDPHRGFAAIGLGIYLRRTSTMGEHPVDTWKDSRQVADQQTRILRELATVFSRSNEPEDLRAACALAIGMSSHPDAAAILWRAVARAKDDSVMPRSYAVLALGMLRDQRAVVLAHQLLQNPELSPLTSEELSRRGLSQSYTRQKILALRALALGVGLAATPDQARLLEHLVGYERFTSQQAIRGLKLSRSASALEPLIEVLENGSSDPPVQLLAAWGLGEMLDPHPTPRLARITEDGNVTLPYGLFIYRADSDNRGSLTRRSTATDLTYQYRSYASPFMYRALADQDYAGMR